MSPLRSHGRFQFLYRQDILASLKEPRQCPTKGNVMTSSNFSDALLLYAICYKCQHEGAANLVGIFAAEDAIDRSAPTHSELNAGLGKLLSAGLIEREPGGFHVTKAGTKLYEAVNAGDGNVSSRLEKMAILIDALDSSIELSPTVSASDYQNAYNAYYRAS